MTHANRNQRILYIFRQLHAVINWRPLFLEGTVVLLTQRVAVDSQVTLHSVTS